MKRLLLLLLPALVFSCNRSTVGEQRLDGNWKMVTVMENNPNRLHVRPSDSKDVVIRFAPTSPGGGNLSGFTPTNEIFRSGYSVADRTLSIPALNMTKVMENPWGALFVDHITSAQQYQIESGVLWITTANSKLVFRRP